MPAVGADVMVFTVRPTKVKLFSLATLGIAIAGLTWAAIQWHALGGMRLAEALSAYGSLAVVLFVLARVAGAVAFVPGSIMAIAAGVLFGPVWGSVYNLVASVLGAAAAFGIARSLAPHWLERKARDGGLLDRLVRGIDEEGWRFVAFVRLVPLFPYNLLNYALGLTPLKWTHYLVASTICMVPADIAYVYLGHASRGVARGDTAGIRNGLLALAGLAALAYLPRFTGVLRKQGDTAHQQRAQR